MGVVVLIFTLAGAAAAEVTRLVVTARQDVLGGDYEKLATQRMAVSAKNACIRGLNQRPRNQCLARGAMPISFEPLAHTVADIGYQRNICVGAPYKSLQESFDGGIG